MHTIKYAGNEAYAHMRTHAHTPIWWYLSGLRWVLSPRCYQSVVMVTQMELLLLAGTRTHTHFDTHLPCPCYSFQGRSNRRRTETREDSRLLIFLWVCPVCVSGCVCVYAGVKVNTPTRDTRDVALRDAPGKLVQDSLLHRAVRSLSSRHVFPLSDTLSPLPAHHTSPRSSHSSDCDVTPGLAITGSAVRIWSKTSIMKTGMQSQLSCRLWDLEFLNNLDPINKYKYLYT